MSTHRVRERRLSPTRGRFQELYPVNADEPADVTSCLTTAGTSRAADALEPSADDAAAEELLRILHDNTRVWAAHSQYARTDAPGPTSVGGVAAQGSDPAPRRVGDFNGQVAAAQERLLRWLSQTSTAARATPAALPLRRSERWVVLR
jgi:hypothetical protein